MSEFEDNLLDSNVIKTVRNLKKKKSSQIEDAEEVLSGNDSTAFSTKKGQGKAANLTLEADSDVNIIQQGSLTGTNATKKNTRKFKSTLSSTGGTAGEVGFAGVTETESKGSVFSRLSMTKAQLKESKESKKSAKKEAEVNFFDNSYLEPIIDLIGNLMSKSKVLRALIEENSLTNSFVNKHTTNDLHFTICFKTFLTQLYREGELSPDLKNLTKSTFARLEKFCAEKMESKIRLEKVEFEIQDHYKEIEAMNKARIAELTSKLSN